MILLFATPPARLNSLPRRVKDALQSVPPPLRRGKYAQTAIAGPGGDYCGWMPAPVMTLCQRAVSDLW